MICKANTSSFSFWDNWYTLYQHLFFIRLHLSHLLSLFLSFSIHFHFVRPHCILRCVVLCFYNFLSLCFRFLSYFICKALRLSTLELYHYHELCICVKARIYVVFFLLLSYGIRFRFISICIHALHQFFIQTRIISNV